MKKNIWATFPRAVRVASWKKGGGEDISIKVSPSSKSKRKGLMRIAEYLMSCGHTTYCVAESFEWKQILKGQFKARGMGLRMKRCLSCGLLSESSQCPSERQRAALRMSLLSASRFAWPRPPAAMVLLREVVTNDCTSPYVSDSFTFWDLFPYFRLREVPTFLGSLRSCA